MLLFRPYARLCLRPAPPPPSPRVAHTPRTSHYIISRTTNARSSRIADASTARPIPSSLHSPTPYANVCETPSARRTGRPLGVYIGDWRSTNAGGGWRMLWTGGGPRGRDWATLYGASASPGTRRYRRLRRHRRRPWRRENEMHGLTKTRRTTKGRERAKARNILASGDCALFLAIVSPSGSLSLISVSLSLREEGTLYFY